MIPTGIPLGRNPTGHGAGAVLWLKGSNLRSGIARAVNIPLECLLGSVLSFFGGGNTSFAHGFGVEVDGFGISAAFSVRWRQISSLGALKSRVPAGSVESLAWPWGLSLPRKVFSSISSKFPQFWSSTEAGESLEEESGQLCALIRVFKPGAGGVNAGSFVHIPDPGKSPCWDDKG